MRVPTAQARGGKTIAAAVGERETTAVEASPTTASGGPAVILAGAITAEVGTSETPTGAGGVPARSRAALRRSGGAPPAGGASLKEEEAVRSEREAHVAEKMGTTEVAMYDLAAVQQEPLAEG